MKLRSLLNALHHKLRSALPYRKIVYRYPKSDIPQLPAAPKILVIEPGETLPGTVLAPLDAEERAQTEQSISGLLARGSRGYILTVDGELASQSWAAPGHLNRDWLIPIKPQDVVLYASSTRHKFRGRGLNLQVMHAALRHEAEGAGEIYIDVAIWNGPARRNIERVGFKQVATVWLRGYL